MVISFSRRSAAIQITDAHLYPRRIELLHLMQNPCFDSIPFPELFRGANNELFFRVDNPADIVGNPAGGKGGMGAPLEDDDVQLGPAAP